MPIGSESADLALYLALALPVDALVLRRRAPSRALAAPLLAALALLAAAVIGHGLANKTPSHYDTLNVHPAASFVEIKKGYKRESVRVHPDKTAAARAASAEDADDDTESEDAAFLAVKHAYDILSDSQKRDVYNKFGPEGLEHQHDTSQLLASLGFFYVVWVALSYLLTRPKAVSRAQTWSFSGLLALGIFEYQSRIAGTEFLEEQLPQLAMFEKIELLHRLVPAFIFGARIVAWMIYEDIDTYNAHVLQRLHAKTDMLLLMIRDTYLAVTSPKPGGGSGGSGSVPAVADATAPPAADVAPWSADDETLQAAFRPLHPAMAGKSAEAAAADAKEREALRKAASKKGRGLSGLVWFFGVYFFFQWLLNRGGGQ